MFAFVTAGQSPAMPRATARRVVVAVVGALLVTGASILAILTLVQKPDWTRGLIAAGVVSALASALSLIPLLWGVRRTLNAAVAGYFLAMGVRLAVSIGGAMLAVHAGGYPQTPTLLLMAVFYVTVLAAESLVVAAATWTMK
ncbi:hypothetical protein [Humisphaera borealis]|nr:hypothetical protein [Humisphaera borealis]